MIDLLEYKIFAYLYCCGRKFICQEAGIHAVIKSRAKELLEQLELNDLITE